MSFTVLGLFDNVEDTARIMKPLEAISTPHDDIRLLSVAPYPDGALYHDKTRMPMWLFALAGGVLGFMLAITVAGGTQAAMNLNVSGKSIVAIPPVAIACYEFSLLGAVLGTFFGMLWYAGLPDWNKLAYDETISLSMIGILVNCESEAVADKVEKIMEDLGAVKTKRGRDDF
ncbi:MAG: DUF3341 domain-containing protein [Nitrospinae bacterium]|nr:DUF3341 domain-containing protein [Nitrospinota bacterium]